MIKAERTHQAQKNIIKLKDQMTQSQSEFLQIGEEYYNKLKTIDESKQIKQNSKNAKLENIVKKLQKNESSLMKFKLSPNLESKLSQKARATGISKIEKPNKNSQAAIKKQFISKLKEWNKQKHQIQQRKREIQEKNAKHKQQLEQKKRLQMQQEANFSKAERKKQLEQRIQQIQERRLKRQQSLKNAVLKRSFHLPKYVQAQKKYVQKEKQKIVLDLKLFKNKKAKESMNPQQLRAHEQAYINRIKQRLNMNVEGSKGRRTKSDFNVFVSKNEELKQIQLQKMIKRKKYQDKLSQIPLSIDPNKKKQVQIQIDKAKNPFKYNFLSQKSLNDRQIYEEFKEFDLQADSKQIGKDYLKQMKQKHKDKATHSNSVQMLPKIEKKSSKDLILPQKKQNSVKIEKQEEKKSQKTKMQSLYSRSLTISKQKDENYMSKIKQRLAKISSQ